MEKINKGLKLKIFALLILSNISVYLLAIPQEFPHSEDIVNNKVFIREDYITLKIEADLKTIYEENLPVMIISKDRTINISHAILLSKKDSNLPHDDFSDTTPITNQYIIYVHKQYLQSLIKKKKFIILPWGSELNFKNNKRGQYELRY